MLTWQKTRKPTHIGEYKGYAVGNYFVLSSSSLVSAVKNEREKEREQSLLLLNVIFC